MSQENVRLVRRIYDALIRDDLDTALALMDERIEYVNPAHAVEPGTRWGHAGIRRNVENMRRAFEFWRFEPEELVDAGEQVIVVGIFEARGKDSGVEVKRRMSRLWTIRDGRAVRYQWFDNEHEAFEAADQPPESRASEPSGESGS